MAHIPAALNKHIEVLCPLEGILGSWSEEARLDQFVSF